MILTPVKAIRAKCLDCCCGQRVEVKLCPCATCSLWPYRLGKRPTPDMTASVVDSKSLSIGSQKL